MLLAVASVLFSHEPARSAQSLPGLSLYLLLPIAMDTLRRRDQARGAPPDAVRGRVLESLYSFWQYGRGRGVLADRIRGGLSHYMTFSGIAMIAGCLLLGLAARGTRPPPVDRGPLSRPVRRDRADADARRLRRDAGGARGLPGGAPAAGSARGDSSRRGPDRRLPAGRPAAIRLDRGPPGRDQPGPHRDGARRPADDRRPADLRPRSGDDQELLRALPRRGRSPLAGAAPSQQRAPDRRRHGHLRRGRLPGDRGARSGPHDRPIAGDASRGIAAFLWAGP